MPHCSASSQARHCCGCVVALVPSSALRLKPPMSAISARSQISPLLRPAAIRLRQRCCLIRPRPCTVSNSVDLNIHQRNARTMSLIHIDSHQVEKTLGPKQSVMALREYLQQCFDPSTDFERSRAEITNGDFL